MTFLEAIEAKIYEESEIVRKINSLRIYGETTIVVYNPEFKLDHQHLAALIGIKEDVDQLLFLTDKNTSQERLFELANLQIIDMVCACAAPNAIIEEINPEYVSYPGDLPPDLEHLSERLVS